MAFEKKEGDGALFHNEQVTEKHPAHKGYVLAHRDIRRGEEVSIALWPGKEGSKQSFKVKMEDKRERRDDAPQQSISQRAMLKGPAKRSIIPDDDMDGDSIPF